MLHCHPQPNAQVAALDLLLDPIGPAVKTALAPPGKVQHGLAQGLGRNRTGMDRHAADPRAVLDHQHRTAALRRQDGSTAAPRAAPEPNEIGSAYRCAPTLPKGRRPRATPTGNTQKKPPRP